MGRAESRRRELFYDDITIIVEKTDLEQKNSFLLP